MATEKEESIDILKLKIKLLTIFLILVIAWQFIDLLRVNSISSNVESCARTYQVDNIQRVVDEMQRDITDLQSDMWSKAETSYIENQIKDVYSWVREYCNSYN